MEMQMMEEDNNKTTTHFNFKTPQQKAQASAQQQQRKPPNGNSNNQNNFMDDPNCMEEMYQFMEELGSGGFGKVKLAVHNLTGERVAVKIIDKKAIGSDLPRVTSELEALKHLAHQNICRMFQFVETEEKYFIVMEFCNGGEMFDYIVRKERLGESEARHFFRQLVQAVAYIHSMGFAHRDLKPENLLLTQDLQLKVIDFGLCAKPLNGLGRPLDTCCGSPAYAAPELIQNSSYYGNEADIWSMGVLLYALLCGNLPFDDTNLPRLYKQILAGVYFEPPYLSELAKDFLRSMLTVDAKRRATIRQILGHPWLNKNYEQQLKWQTIYSREVVDEEVLRELVYFHRVDRGQMEAIVREWHFDYGTATYLILLQRKERKQNFALPFNYDRLPLSPTIHSSLGHDLDLSGMEAMAMATANSSTGHSSTSNASDEPLVTSMGEKLNKLAMATDPLLVLRKGASPQNGHAEGGKARPMSMLVNALGPRVLPAHQQQQQQRPTTAPGTRTTGPPPLNYYNMMQGEGGGSNNSTGSTAKSVYTTPRRAGGTVTPRAGGTVGRMVSPVLYRRPTSAERPNHPALADPKTPASSQQNGNVGQRLPSAPPIRSNSTDQAVMASNSNGTMAMTMTTTTSEPLTLTPLSNERVARRDTKSSKQQRSNNNNFEQDNNSNSGKAKPGKSPSRLRQRVFSSLERKADKMINLLTPKRVRSEAPTKLKCIKAMVNVSVTSSEDPKQVLDELWKVLHEQGMETTQNGWKICGSKKGGAFGSTTTVELEVVVIEGLQYVGVKRKRIQGDSFMYKRICEEVLLLAGL